MSLVGADVAALRWFAASLDLRTREIEANRHRLSSIVDGIAWSGPDRDRFVEGWHRIHGQALVSICEELSNDARQARQHADQQEQASRRW